MHAERGPEPVISAVFSTKLSVNLPFLTVKCSIKTFFYFIMAATKPDKLKSTDALTYNVDPWFTSFEAAVGRLSLTFARSLLYSNIIMLSPLLT